MNRCSLVVAWLCFAVLPVAFAQNPEGKDEEKDLDFIELSRAGKDAVRGGNWVEAEKIFKRATEIRPNDEECRFLLGTALIQTGQFREALGCLERLAVEFPERPELKNNIAWVLVKSTDPSVRNLERGLRFAREAVIDSPNDLNIWGTLAEAHYQLGHYEKAARIARIAFDGAKMREVSNFSEYGNLLRRCLRASGVTEDNGGRD